ncbi:Phosphoesterase domain [Macleaya cordata]|uniref:Purple acid phosphatase n=1 Tax=Macleaya cordata TaxID=56857 RepID=A0A200QFF1_MACCD|nr:Phosphoesterase domain [Macleaya cordata]
MANQNLLSLSTFSLFLSTKPALNLSMLPSKTPLFFFYFFFISTLFTNSFSSPVSITLTPKTLTKSGDSVKIQWTGIESPSDYDWLGIYSPPNSSNDNYIGYVYLSSCKNWKSGSCSIELPLVNLRSNYEFRIFRWTEKEIDKKNLDHDHNPLPGTKHLLAKSKELGFELGGGPEQIHLALTEKDDEMRVMFITGDGKENYVKYGEEEDEMDEMVKTVVRRYEREDMCDSPANESIGWRDPGFIHDGVMKNLKMEKRYYYKVGSDSGGWSATHSFMSWDGNSDETNAFLFGDMGTSTPYLTFMRTQDESKSTLKWVLRDIEALGDKPSFISHIGDISYARGYSWLWDTFFTQIEPVASKVPYHVCIGNHEYDWPLQPWKPDWAQTVYKMDGGGECGVPYSLKFTMPGNSSVLTGTRAPATRNLYYSFNSGVVHFVYMSTETNFLPGSDQYNFIKHDLENVDRKKTPFVVVQGHRPMYTTSNEGRDAPLRDRMLEHYEPLFVKNKVTIALWGHVHRYERFCPMKNYTCGEEEEGLPVHVVIGMAGQDWQPIWEPRPDHPKDPIFPQPERSLYRAGEFGYTRLFATKEKLTLTYIGNHDGEPHDMVEILSSGRVLKGVADSSNKVVVKSTFSWFVKGASILVLGAFMGYVIGFISHAKRVAASGTSWTPVKSDDV